MDNITIPFLISWQDWNYDLAILMKNNDKWPLTSYMPFVDTRAKVRMSYCRGTPSFEIEQDLKATSQSVEQNANQLLRAVGVTPEQMVELYTPFGVLPPTTEAEFLQLEQNIRRRWRILERQPGNLAQGIMAQPRQAHPGMYYADGNQQTDGNQYFFGNDGAGDSYGPADGYGARPPE